MVLRRIFGPEAEGKLRNEEIRVSCSSTYNVKVLNSATIRWVESATHMGR
jgi:hypothetical protein